MNQHESTFTFTNAEDASVEITFEPFGMPYEIPPGMTLRVIARGDIQGELALDEDGGIRTLYSWPTSTAKVYLGDKLLDDYHLPVPGIPDGMSMPDFIDRLFGQGEPGSD